MYLNSQKGLVSGKHYRCCELKVNGSPGVPDLPGFMRVVAIPTGMSTDAIDYGRLEAGRDCNYWDLDRTLRFEAERTYEGEDWDWAREKLAEWGEIVGTTITEQTHRVMRSLTAIVEEAGLMMADVVKCTCFLQNLDDFQTFNEVYGSYFQDKPPARECVEVSRLPKGMLVEVSAICVSGGS